MRRTEGRSNLQLVTGLEVTAVAVVVLATDCDGWSCCRIPVHLVHGGEQRRLHADRPVRSRRAAPTTPPCRKFNSYNQPSVNAEPGGGDPGAQPRRPRAGAARPWGLHARHGHGGPGRQDPRPRHPGAGAQQPRHACSSSRRPSRASTSGRTPWPRAATTSRCGQVSTDTGETVEQLGTTGIYTNPFGDLITGASKLGVVPEFSFFEVPEAPGTPFDVFPGAPAVTDGATIVFKGNYTVDLVGKTGVYYRDLVDEPIPLGGHARTRGRHQPRGADRQQHGHPHSRHKHGVRLHRPAQRGQPPGGVRRLRQRGEPDPRRHLPGAAGRDDASRRSRRSSQSARRSPGRTARPRFNRLGEGVSFDGRFVAFWGAWGGETKTLRPAVPEEGNARPSWPICNDSSIRMALHGTGSGAPGHLRPRHQDRADPGGRQVRQRTSTTSSTGTSRAGPRARAKETTTASWRAGAPRASWPFPGWSMGA